MKHVFHSHSILPEQDKLSGSHQVDHSRDALTLKNYELEYLS